MTKPEAVAQASRWANKLRQSVDVWEHTGNRTHPAQGRFLARRQDQPEPRFNRWTRILTVFPEES